MSRIRSEVKHENSKSSLNEKAEILTQAKSLNFEFNEVKFGDLKESKMIYFIVLHSIRVCVLQNGAVNFAEGCTLLEPWSLKND